MSPDEFLDRIRSLVVGWPVSYVRLAANSLLVYVGCEPGDEQGVMFWFEPTWHVRGPGRILTGSRHAQEDRDALDPSAGFKAAARAVDELMSRTIDAVDIEPITQSLILTLGGGYQVRTFVSDPTSDLDWHIDDNAAGMILEGCAQALELVQRR